MLRKLRLSLTLLLMVLMFMDVYASVGDSNSESAISYDKKKGKPKIFIEGIRLDMDYLRRNMQFVDFVTEPAVADVHIIITQQMNGSGGFVYSLMYNNRTFENIGDYTLTCTSPSSDTEDERRRTIVETLKRGLMPYANETEIFNNLSIRYSGQENIQTAKVDDPWNHWTFRGNFSSNLNTEASRKNYSYFATLRGDKVTDNWKFRNYAQVNVRGTEYTRDSIKYISENINKNFSSNVVKSLSTRWSAGAFLGYSNSNYTNIFYTLSFKPALEYNIFPWDISDRKVFTIAYYVGPVWQKYYEETIYNKLSEGLWSHSLVLDLQLVNTWGEIQASLEASNYLHDFSKNRLTFDSELSVRIIRGLSVSFDLRIESIHDQIYLPKGEASLEDILLNKVQLPSTFKVGTGIGVQIQFGSIYNNIINNRL